LLGVAVDECHAAAQTSLPQICESRIAAPVSRVLANYPDFSHAPLLSGIIASSTQRLPSAVSSTGPLPFTPASEEIEGIASMYNPSEPDDEDPRGLETASGEKYDPETWSAAIRIDLRNKFGGIGFGTKYQPSYALVESKDKRAIVKINDVGPLKPDRIIDLNIRAMHYFDPSLGLGLIDVKVIPLIGTGIMPGPLKTNPSTNFAGWFT
jgi:rare lipoprotein A